MKTTDYYKPQVSPLQILRRTPDIRDENHPVQEFIRQNLGTYTLTATFLPDEHTLQTLNLPGLAAFLCVLRCGDQILAEGRSMTLIGKMNKFFEKSIAIAKNQSLLDAVAKGSRVLEVLPLNTNPQQDTKVFFPDVYKEREVTGGITEKQKNYLLQLLRSNDASEEEIEEVDGLSKEEAAEKIGFLVPQR
jgi:hypothetical protein